MWQHLLVSLFISEWETSNVVVKGAYLQLYWSMEMPSFSLNIQIKRKQNLHNKKIFVTCCAAFIWANTSSSVCLSLLSALMMECWTHETCKNLNCHQTTMCEDWVSASSTLRINQNSTKALPIMTLLGFQTETRMLLKTKSLLCLFPDSANKCWYRSNQTKAHQFYLF